MILGYFLDISVYMIDTRIGIEICIYIENVTYKGIFRWRISNMINFEGESIMADWVYGIFNEDNKHLEV
jgi:hypothetical protein